MPPSRSVPSFIFGVVDADRAIVALQDHLYATTQIAQTTLRGIVSQVERDNLLSARGKSASSSRRIIDEVTEP